VLASIFNFFPIKHLWPEVGSHQLPVFSLPQIKCALLGKPLVACPQLRVLTFLPVMVIISARLEFPIPEFN
jgi:hypothetical protein